MRLTPAARALRRRPTMAESLLWARLRNRGLFGCKFRRQAPVGPYVADFLCAEARLVVEVDGGQHAQSGRDAARDVWLGATGYVVARYWNNDVLGNIEGVLQDIAARLADRAQPLTPTLSPEGRRSRAPAQPSQISPPLPRAGEGRGEGGGAARAVRSAPPGGRADFATDAAIEPEDLAPPLAPPLPRAGEGRGEGGLA